MAPVVLVGVGNGKGLPADAATCEVCCDMVTDDGGVISVDGAVADDAAGPFGWDAEDIYGGLVGVLGWTTAFVWWSVVLARTW